MIDEMVLDAWGDMAKTVTPGALLTRAQADANMKYLQTAGKAVPALVAEVRQLRAENERLRAALIDAIRLADSVGRQDLAREWRITASTRDQSDSKERP